MPWQKYVHFGLGSRYLFGIRPTPVAADRTYVATLTFVATLISSPLYGPPMWYGLCSLLVSSPLREALRWQGL